MPATMCAMCGRKTSKTGSTCWQSHHITLHHSPITVQCITPTTIMDCSWYISSLKERACKVEFMRRRKRKKKRKRRRITTSVALNTTHIAFAFVTFCVCIVFVLYCMIITREGASGWQVWEYVGWHLFLFVRRLYRSWEGFAPVPFCLYPV